MSSYFLINLFIIAFPLALSFERKVKYYKNFPPLFFAIVTGAIPYLIWDSIAAHRGDWSFNPDHVFDHTLMSLPVEEILFFFTVPFSSLFIYESLSVNFREYRFKFNRLLFLILPIILFCGAAVFSTQYYTSTVLVFSGVFFLTAILFSDTLIKSSTYWLYILISYIPFLIVNYVLTSIPIVIYNHEAIWGKRFLTIPLEDFFYSFSMLSFYLFFYLIYKNIWQKITQLQ